MPKLKISAIADDKPVKLSIELPAAVFRDLTAYAEILGRDTGQKVDPSKLIAPMLERFIAGDRAFAKARNLMKGSRATQGKAGQQTSNAPD